MGRNSGGTYNVLAVDFYDSLDCTHKNKLALGSTRQSGVQSVSQPAVGRLSFELDLRRDRLSRSSKLVASVSGRNLLFASTTLTVGSRGKSCMRETFEAIDRGRKGFINESDLAAYAAEHGLPADYVSHFLEAVQSNTGTNVHSIRYHDFSTYVKSREDSLLEAFKMFDLNGDGQLTPKELDKSLESIRIECPQSHNVYKCRKQVVKRLVGSMAVPGQDAITFCDFRRFFLLLPQRDMMVDYWLSAACPGKCDIGGCVVIREPGAKGSPVGHLLAGAVAGAVSRTATAPLETIRIQSMTGAISSSNTMQAAQQLMHTGGWKSLFKGNLVNVLKSAPQKAIDFFVFEAFKSSIGANVGGSMGTLLSAGLAGATSTALLYPLEVVRSRVTCDTLGRYRGVADAMRQMAQADGVGVLYRGLAPSIAAIIPEAAITYGMFDILKSSYARMTGRQEAGVMPSLAFGITAAFMGQLVAYPLETISRRMQMSVGKKAAGSVVHTTRALLHAEGLAGLYKGLGAASARTIPMAFLSFGTYELVRASLLHVEKQSIRKQYRHTCHSRPAMQGSKPCRRR